MVRRTGGGNNDDEDDDGDKWIKEWMNEWMNDWLIDWLIMIIVVVVIVLMNDDWLMMNDDEDDEDDDDDDDDYISYILSRQEFSTAEEVFIHCSSHHNFNLQHVADSWHLDCFGYIKMINFIRAQVNNKYYISYPQV